VKAFGAETQELVTLEEIEAAAERIRGVALNTPLLPFPEASARVGGEIRLKCESLQPGGSFKIRGAFNFMSQMTDAELACGVVTYSSGNHGQALALAAKARGARAVVVMPTTAPAVKVEGVRDKGGEVIFAGTTSQERMARAEALAQEEGLVVVPPFDHPRIIAGQGTVGLEIARDWPEVEVVLVPIGGGGQISGLSVALKGLLPGVRVIGVEPEGAPAMRTALEVGKPVTLERTESIADGLKPVRVGDLTFRHAQALLDDVVLVDDPTIRAATSFLLHRRKLVVEYSGAATLAAVLGGAVEARDRKVAVVLSGGNLDASAMEELARSPQEAGGLWKSSLASRGGTS
jgi:threonine dehydratase